MRPLVGITGDIEEINGRTYLYIDLRYGKLVEDTGGIPLLIHPTDFINRHVGSSTPAAPMKNLNTSPIPPPPIPGGKGEIFIVKDVISKIDALLLSGGEDIHPKYYREEPRYPMTPSPDLRTEFEFSLLREAMISKIPILGICHGMQLINVALGGTLYQDLPAQTEGIINHRLGEKRHRVSIEGDSLLFNTIGEKEIDVTSTHHQAVKDLGMGLKVSATAHDGIIEAFEMPGYPFLIGVQWHPEKEPDENSRKLFSTFLQSDFS